MNKIESQVIGELVPHEEVEEWWQSKPIAIPFFAGQALAITFMNFELEDDPSYLWEVDQALRHFLAKGDSDRLELSGLVYKNCMDFLNAIGFDEMDKPLWDMKKEEEVWKFVYPQEIEITRRNRRDKDIYLTVACECSWEQEHGLQLVFRQGKQLTRVSAQDGWTTEADAFGKPDSEDELLSRFEV